MDMIERWAKVTTTLADVKPRKLKHYDKTLRSLVEAGFKLATPEMATKYSKIFGEIKEDPNDDADYVWRPDNCTDVEIKQKEPDNYGLYLYNTHDRAEDISMAIETLATIHQKDIQDGKAWLMPVYDDEEYVSWCFDIAVGTEQEVLARLPD